jgi:uncharacterized membrane protein
MFDSFTRIFEAFFGQQSIFDEARESVVGGCLGVLMSGVFLFFFFFAGLALLTGGITDFNLELTVATLPVILLLGLSAFISPFLGVALGLQSGQYRMGRHIVYFLIWLGLLMTGIIALSLFL